MNRNTYWVVSLCIGTAFLAAGLARQTHNNIESEVAEVAQDVYIYGYPLVSMEIKRQVMTNVVKPSGDKAPMGQFATLNQYPTPLFKGVRAPSPDTLFSMAWVDVGREPYILHLPNEKNHYFLVSIFSAWTNVIADPGSRLGSDQQDIALIGPYWEGELPDDVKIVKSPTDLIWILAKTYSKGTPENFNHIFNVQEEFNLTPLSAYNKHYSPKLSKVVPTLDMETPVRDQVNHLSAEKYFSLLTELMKKNPPANEDKEIIKKMATLGMFPGKPFDIHHVDGAVAKGLEQAVIDGQAKIIEHQNQFGKIQKGWIMPNKTGDYGIDYLQRAFMAFYDLAANLPEDEIYLVTDIDQHGEVLNGANKYVIHFSEDEIPPVEGFWALTMYDDQLYLTENSLNRYALGQYNSLQREEDGSIDIYIQHDSPGKSKESNWLPAPEGNFILMLRLYWPKETIFNHKWCPPDVKKQNY